MPPTLLSWVSPKQSSRGGLAGGATVARTFSSKCTEPLLISPLLKIPNSFAGGAGLAGKMSLLAGKNAWAGAYLCWLRLGGICRKTLERKERR